MARSIRAYVPAPAAGERTLDEQASRYLTRVHRLTAGDRFTAFDPETCLEADGEILDARSKLATIRLEPARAASRISPLDVTLLQALGKGDKADQVVRDATALGARRIVFVQSERSVVRLDEPARAETRRLRWRTIALESARQSGRGDLPEIAGPLPLVEALTDISAARRICLDGRAERPLRAALGDFDLKQPIALLIGPEGGLAPDEVELAVQHGFVRAALGALVLRTETAAIAVLGAVVALCA